MDTVKIADWLGSREIRSRAYHVVMTPKPWPGTMIAALILSGVVTVAQVGCGIWFIILYVLSDTASRQETDSLMPLALFGGIMLICLAVVLGLVTSVLFIRSPLARIIYTAMVILGAVLSFILLGLYALAPNLVLLTTTALLWLPASKPFFSNLPGVSYYPDRGLTASR